MNETKSVPIDAPEGKPKFEGATLVPAGTFAHAMEPRNFEETIALANLLAKSDLVPKDFQNKPANIVIAIGLGREVGVGWAQALQNIAVINGRPSMWGDLVMALVLNSDVYQDSKDWFDPNLEGGTCFFASKRKGKSETVRQFSHDDAKKAGLLGKDTYQKYEKRMLFNRARAWALRDDYSDILKGLRIREEEDDIIDVREQSDGTYAMPQARVPAPKADAPSPATTTAAAEPTPVKEVPAPESSHATQFTVNAVAKTTIGDRTVIVVKTETGMKLYAGPELYDFLKAAEKAGHRLEAVVETENDKTWIVEVKLAA